MRKFIHWIFLSSLPLSVAHCEELFEISQVSVIEADLPSNEELFIPENIPSGQELRASLKKENYYFTQGLGERNSYSDVYRATSSPIRGFQLGISYSYRLDSYPSFLFYAESEIVMFTPENRFKEKFDFLPWIIPYTGILYEIPNSQIQIGLTAPIPLAIIPIMIPFVLLSPGLVLRVPISDNLFLRADRKILMGFPPHVSSSISLEYCFA